MERGILTAKKKRCYDSYNQGPLLSSLLLQICTSRNSTIAVFLCCLHMYICLQGRVWMVKSSVSAKRNARKKKDTLLMTLLFLTCRYFSVLQKLGEITWHFGIFVWSDFQVSCGQLRCYKGVQGLQVDWTCSALQNSIAKPRWMDITGSSVRVMSAAMLCQESDWILAHALVWLRSSVNLASEFPILILMLLLFYNMPTFYR